MNSNREVLRLMVTELLKNTEKDLAEIIRNQRTRVKKMFGLENNMKDAYLYLLDLNPGDNLTLKEIIFSIRSHFSEGKLPVYCV